MDIFDDEGIFYEENWSFYFNVVRIVGFCGNLFFYFYWLNKKKDKIYNVLFF